MNLADELERIADEFASMVRGSVAPEHEIAAIRRAAEALRWVSVEERPPMTDLADELGRIATSNSDLTGEERDACRRAAEALRWAERARGWLENCGERQPDNGVDSAYLMLCGAFNIEPEEPR